MSKQENKEYSLFYLKLSILLFWGSWFSIAFLTNTTDFLIAADIMSPLPFRSGNFNLIKNIMSIYNIPSDISVLLFSINLFVQGAIAILFLTAAFSFWQQKSFWLFSNIAFGLSIALWAVFLILEEVFIAYAFEATHIRLFEFELVSLLFLYLLPQQIKK